MKGYSFFLLMFITSFTYAQQPKVNNIKEVNTLNIYGNNTKNIIGTLIVNPTAHTKVLYVGYTQTKDSLGIYTTWYRFLPDSKEASFNFNITIVFDTTFITSRSDSFLGVSGNGLIYAIHSCNIKKKTLYGKGTVTGDDLIFEVKSLTPLFATIYGVDGVIK